MIMSILPKASPLQEHATMSLANEAAEALRSAFNLLQKELGRKLSQIDEVDAIFTWEGQDYRVSLQPYDEPLLPK